VIPAEDAGGFELLLLGPLELLLVRLHVTPGRSTAIRLVTVMQIEQLLRLGPKLAIHFHH
jgi:hypothetical protein